MTRRARLHPDRREGGFTLIEMVIAMLIMAIVLSALAPGFYGLMRATSTTNYRSIADGIAIQASEQMRSVPYYEVGYYTTPSGCPDGDGGTPAVVLASSIPAPLAGMATTKSVNGVTYTIQRCVNWIDASNGDAQAYKQAVITVSWTVNRVSGQVTQTSALYPGGETYTYAQTGGSTDFAPGGPPTTVAAGSTPQPPTVTSVAPDTGTDPTQNLLVSWTAPTSGPTSNITYEVFWTTDDPGRTDPYPQFSNQAGYNEQIVSNGTSTDITVGPATTAWVQVYTVYASTLSAQSNTMSGTTNAGSAASCTLTGITVTPDGTSTSPVVLDDTGSPLYAPSVFTVSVTDSGPCTGITVGYNPSGCVLATVSPAPSGTCTPNSSLTLLPGSGGNGTVTATTPGGTVWSAGTQDFLVYLGGAIYAPVTEAQSYMCTENGTTGTC